MEPKHTTRFLLWGTPKSKHRISAHVVLYPMASRARSTSIT